jgi:hypothetical protein
MDKIVDRIKRNVSVLNPKYKEIIKDLDMVKQELDHVSGYKRAIDAVDKAFENKDPCSNPDCANGQVWKEEKYASGMINAGWYDCPNCNGGE